MVAPLPDLIFYRMTSGIYYHMRERFKATFDAYFGHLLNEYVGSTLKQFVAADRLFSENAIRKIYPTSAGKVPDWVIVDGKTAIFIEVKVARVHRIVYATGDDGKLQENLEAVRRGLVQMHEFEQAVRSRRVNLSPLLSCKEFINIVVTLEPTYLANSDPFKDRIRCMLEERRSLKWGLISLDDLEWFQVHLSDPNMDLASAFRLCLQWSPDKVGKDLARLSGRTFKDSYLHQTEKQLYRRIGLPNDI